MSEESWEVKKVLSTLREAANILERTAKSIRHDADSYDERNDAVYIISAMQSIINMLPNVRLDMFLSGALYVERSNKEQ